MHIPPISILHVLPISCVICTTNQSYIMYKCATCTKHQLYYQWPVTIDQVAEFICVSTRVERVCARQRNSWDGGNLECQAKHRDSCRMYRWLHALSPLCQRKTGVSAQDPNRGAAAECAGDCTNTTVPERGALLAGRNTGVLYSYKTQTEGQLQTVTKTKKQKQSKSTQAEENVRKRAREYKQYIL